MFLSDEILPPDPDGLDVLHDREYRVRAFRMSADRILIRGAVRDQKPPGVYLADDPEPLTMHHMQVDLVVAFPSMVIESAEVVFEAHPHTTCVNIVDTYQGLVGLSITRGFTHKVRELFGGPRGLHAHDSAAAGDGPGGHPVLVVDVRRRGPPRGPVVHGLACRDDPRAARAVAARQPQHLPRVGRGRRDDDDRPRRRPDRDDAPDPQALREARRPRGGVGPAGADRGHSAVLW